MDGLQAKKNVEQAVKPVSIIISRWGFAEANAGLRTALDAQLTESVSRI